MHFYFFTLKLHSVSYILFEYKEKEMRMVNRVVNWKLISPNLSIQQTSIESLTYTTHVAMEIQDVYVKVRIYK